VQFELLRAEHTSHSRVIISVHYYSLLMTHCRLCLTNNVQNYMQPANENQNDIQLLPTTLTATLHVCTLHKH